MSSPTGFDEASVAGALDAGLHDMALDLEAGQREGLVAYLRLLHRWNRVYNLSGVRDPVQMVRRHVLDSLSVLPFVRGGSLLDAGSGAGLPGLMLAIARPEIRCVLLDRAAKRVRFLVQCVAELGIGNADPVRARVEDFPNAQRFSTVVSRATFAIAEMWRACEGLLEPDGRALAMTAGTAGGGGAVGVERAGACAAGWPSSGSPGSPARVTWRSWSKASRASRRCPGYDCQGRLGARLRFHV